VVIERLFENYEEEEKEVLAEAEAELEVFFSSRERQSDGETIIRNNKSPFRRSQEVGRCIDRICKRRPSCRVSNEYSWSRHNHGINDKCVC